MTLKEARDSTDASSHPATLFVGVDGGGSSCRVRLRDATGQIRAAVTAGPANVYLAFADAVGVLRAALGEAVGTAGGASHDRLHIGLGLAGVSSDEVAARVRLALADLAATVSVTSDTDIACLGAHEGRDGGLIVAGTGSGAVARLQGRRFAIGGRGFVLGDDGSGARLGLEALRLALRAHDALSPHTSLTRRLMARFDDDPIAAIGWGRTARSRDYAALAPIVVAAAADGDAVGRSVVDAAAAALAGLADALQRRGVPRLSLVGGLAPILMPFLPQAMIDALSPPLLDALDGALILAGCPCLPSTRPPA